MSNLALYSITVLVWGSTWLVINFQLGTVAAEVSVVYRYAIAAFLLFAWALFHGLKLRYGLFAHFRFFLLGLLLFSFNYIATYNAQEYIPSALNAVAFSTMMWMNVLNTRLFFGARIEPRLWFGALLGMAGILILFWPEVSELSFTDRTLVGAGLRLSGALLASFGNMVILGLRQLLASIRDGKMRVCDLFDTSRTATSLNRIWPAALATRLYPSKPSRQEPCRDC